MKKDPKLVIQNAIDRYDKTYDKIKKIFKKVWSVYKRDVVIKEILKIFKMEESLFKNFSSAEFGKFFLLFEPLVHAMFYFTMKKNTIVVKNLKETPEDKEFFLKRRKYDSFSLFRSSRLRYPSIDLESLLRSSEVKIKFHDNFVLECGNFYSQYLRTHLFLDFGSLVKKGELDKETFIEFWDFIKNARKLLKKFNFLQMKKSSLFYSGSASGFECSLFNIQLNRAFLRIHSVSKYDWNGDAYSKDPSLCGFERKDLEAILTNLKKLRRRREEILEFLKGIQDFFRDYGVLFRKYSKYLEMMNGLIKLTE